MRELGGLPSSATTRRFPRYVAMPTSQWAVARRGAFRRRWCRGRGGPGWPWEPPGDQRCLLDGDKSGSSHNQTYADIHREESRAGLELLDDCQHEVCKGEYCARGEGDCVAVRRASGSGGRWGERKTRWPDGVSGEDEQDEDACDWWPAGLEERSRRPENGEMVRTCNGRDPDEFKNLAEEQGRLGGSITGVQAVHDYERHVSLRPTT